jgi:hypothetical protein
MKWSCECACVIYILCRHHWFSLACMTEYFHHIFSMMRLDINVQIESKISDEVLSSLHQLSWSQCIEWIQCQQKLYLNPIILNLYSDIEFECVMLKLNHSFHKLNLYFMISNWIGWIQIQFILALTFFVGGHWNHSIPITDTTSKLKQRFDWLKWDQVIFAGLFEAEGKYSFE